MHEYIVTETTSYIIEAADEEAAIQELSTMRDSVRAALVYQSEVDVEVY
jgi:hypothetical protein